MLFRWLLVVLNVVFVCTAVFQRPCVLFAQHRKPEGVGKTCCTSVKWWKFAHGSRCMSIRKWEMQNRCLIRSRAQSDPVCEKVSGEFFRLLTSAEITPLDWEESRGLQSANSINGRGRGFENRRGDTAIWWSLKKTAALRLRRVFKLRAISKVYFLAQLSAITTTKNHLRT